MTRALLRQRRKAENRSRSITTIIIIITTITAIIALSHRVTCIVTTTIITIIIITIIITAASGFIFVSVAIQHRTRRCVVWHGSIPAFCEKQHRHSLGPALVPGADQPFRILKDLSIGVYRKPYPQALPYPDRCFDAAAMALAISFVPDPIKAVTEMMRVVRPGGWVAAYMWDQPGGGTPVEPMLRALKSLGIAVSLPGIEVSRRENMLAVWEKAGLQSIDTHVISIPVVYSDFDDFWQSYSVPDGPSGQPLRKMSPSEIEKLKGRLREQLPTGPDGHIAYEAFANSVSGRAPS